MTLDDLNQVRDIRVSLDFEIMERQNFLQESRTDIDSQLSEETQRSEGGIDRTDEDVDTVNEDSTSVYERSGTEDYSNPEECSSRTNPCVICPENLPYEEISENQTENDEIENNVARLERYENYLERYGPQLERYGDQLERFGDQLERIGPQLERCGNSLERFGPQLEALGRQLTRSGSQIEGNVSEPRSRNLQMNNTSFHTQTESGNEGFSPLSPDSCQGSSTTASLRQGQWINAPNTRRLSRRPSFQVNDGLIRHWIRRRNLEGRDVVPFNRFREDRRRSIWRNEGDLREFRRARGSWRQNEFFHRSQDNRTTVRDSYDESGQSRSPRSLPNDQQENAGLLQQDHVRIQRSDTLHQDDPDFGFILLDDHDSPGPSRPDTSSQSVRRPRSHMSLRPLNVFSPPLLGPIAEYNAESDEENNEQRHDIFARRATRAREGSVIRSWFMMNNYFQPRPLFIGQGDSKAMDGPFTLQRMPTEDVDNNGNERNVSDLGRVPRPIPRNSRLDRRLRHQVTFHAST